MIFMSEKKWQKKKIHLEIYFKSYLELKEEQSLENTHLENNNKKNPAE